MRETSSFLKNNFEKESKTFWLEEKFLIQDKKRLLKFVYLNIWENI